MKKAELQSKIDKLNKGIASKATPSNLVATLKAQKEKFENELKELEKAEKKPTKKTEKPTLAKFKKAAAGKSAGLGLKRDSERKALPLGKRVSKSGNEYWEGRENRTDSQTKSKPYLKEGGVLDKDIANKINQDLKLIQTKKEKYQKELKQLKDEKSIDKDTITYLEYELESLDKLHDKLSKVLDNKMEKGGDLYDDMDEDIAFANKRARSIANSLATQGYKVQKVEEGDYDVNPNITLSDKLTIDVGLENEISIVIEEGDGKFRYIDCDGSVATLLNKLKKVDAKYFDAPTNKKGIKLTLSDKDSYDYTYKQDGATASITFAFGKEPFTFDVKKISKSLEKHQQDILDAFVIQGIKQHEYKGGFSEAIKHLDTSVVYEPNAFKEEGSISNEEYDKLNRDYNKYAALYEDATGEEKEEYKKQLDKLAIQIHKAERKYEKGGFVAVSEKDGYWYIMSKPTTKEAAEQLIALGVPKGEEGKVVTLEEAKAHKKVIGAEYLEKGGYMAKGGALEHGLKVGDTIRDVAENSVAIYNVNDKKSYVVDLDKGTRTVWIGSFKDRKKYAADGAYMAEGGDVVLWGVKKGDPDWEEVIITNKSENIEKAKKWAEENGFDRLRVSNIDMNEAPDFTKTFAKGGTIAPNLLIELWFAVQKGQSDKYNDLAKKLDENEVSWKLQNAVSDDARFVKENSSKKQYDTFEVKERIEKITSGYMAKGGAVPSHFGSGKNIEVFGYKTKKLRHMWKSSTRI